MSDCWFDKDQEWPTVKHDLIQDHFQLWDEMTDAMCGSKNPIKRSN